MGMSIMMKVLTIVRTQMSLCRGIRGALWAPLSPLHNDIWVLTIVKTFIIILINEGAQRAPYSSSGAKNEIADHGQILQKVLLTQFPFILQNRMNAAKYM